MTPPEEHRYPGARGAYNRNCCRLAAEHFHTNESIRNAWQRRGAIYGRFSTPFPAPTYSSPNYLFGRIPRSKVEVQEEGDETKHGCKAHTFGAVPVVSDRPQSLREAGVRQYPNTMTSAAVSKIVVSAASHDWLSC